MNYFSRETRKERKSVIEFENKIACCFCAYCDICG